jgi:hypothetical protein
LDRCNSGTVHINLIWRADVPWNLSRVSVILCSYRPANGVILRPESPTECLEYSAMAEVNSALERTTQLHPSKSKNNHETRQKKWLKERGGNTIQELDLTAAEERRIPCLLGEIQTRGLLNMRR